MRSVARPYRGSPSRSGFSLIEMIIVVVVISVLLGLAVPPLAELRESMRIDAAAQQLVGDLRRVQVEAIKRNQSARLQRTGATTYNLEFVGDQTLDSGVTFADESSDVVQMASFGPPIGGGATFILRSATRQKTIAVSAAGLLSVQ